MCWIAGWVEKDGTEIFIMRVWALKPYRNVGNTPCATYGEEGAFEFASWDQANYYSQYCRGPTKFIRRKKGSLPLAPEDVPGWYRHSEIPYNEKGFLFDNEETRALLNQTSSKPL